MMIFRPTLSWGVFDMMTLICGWLALSRIMPYQCRDSGW